MTTSRRLSIQSLPSDVRKAVETAQTQRDSAFAPYSNFHVCAVLLLRSGEMIAGVNYESASYGLTLCAERSAIARAQAEGKLSDLKSIIIIASRKDGQALDPVAPCGACRQWIAELADRLGRDFPVYCCDSEANTCLSLTALSLLPEAFLPKSMK